MLYHKPRQNKTNKMTVRPAKTQSSLCAQWVAEDPSFLHADSEDSDQTGRMPRLIFRWAHGRFVGFVMSRLIFGNRPESNIKGTQTYEINLV